jgi:integrase
MARTVQDARLSNRSNRAKLAQRGKPYYRTITEGLHLGYRKNQGPGKWVVRRYLEGGKYEVITLEGVADDVLDANGETVLSFAEAQERAREIHNAPHKPVGPYTVGEAIKDYLLHLRQQGKVSERDAENRFHVHVSETMRAMKVDSLTAESLRHWHHRMANAPKMTRTGKVLPLDRDDSEAMRKRKTNANRVLAYLKAALNLAFHDEKAFSTAQWDRVKPFEKVNRARLRYLTTQEAQRLLNTCSGNFRDLVRGGLETGARYSELARLKSGDYNPDSGTVYIHESKSGHSRHIMLTEAGRQFFAKLVAGQAPEAWMFGKAWGKNHQVEPMKLACKRARLDDVTFHTLRHTWASLAIMAGAPLMAVATNLGHRDTKMVEIHYGHLSKGYVAEAVDKFAPRFDVADDRAKVEEIR